MRLLVLAFATVLSTATVLASEFTPPTNSPLARGEHPRLFLNSEGISKMRTRIRDHYKSDFQTFVNHMDGLFNTSPGSGELGDWNDVFGAARSFALLHQVDPSTVGVSARYSKAEYGRKALDIGLYIASRLPGSWNEAHHGASTLTTKEGGVGSLALQVVYDWTHSISTVSERRQMADKLIAIWNTRYNKDKVKLENHWAANVHIWSGALGMYGDTDLGSSYTAKIQEMMDGFQKVFITRQMEVSERVFEGSSDWMEGDSYSMDGYAGIMFLAAAASGAMGENLFLKYSWLRDAPYYIYYSIMPKPYDGYYYFAQQNTSRTMSTAAPTVSSIMNLVGAMVVEEDPEVAGFAAWFCQESPYGQVVNQYKYYKPHLYDFFYKFMFGTKHIEPLTPDQAKITLSKHLGQMHVMRSDHDEEDATLVQFFAHKYWYPNGHNEPEMGAFNIHRFGTLAIAPSNTKNGIDGVPRVQDHGKGYALNNVFGLGGDKYLEADFGSVRAEHNDTPDRFVEGADSHVGTVEAREYREGVYDYVNYDYTRSYKGGNKTSLARRALVYLRGPVNQEYVVVLDRVNSSQEKMFTLHTPTGPDVVGGSWSGSSGAFKTTSAKQVKVVNRLGQSHAQMYVTSVLPDDGKFHTVGGPGKEWVWADGSKLPYSGFSEIAAYLLSAHTIHIRSQANQFVTVMQLGDANTMGAAASAEKITGNGYAGVLLNKDRLVLFSESETHIGGLSYNINSSANVKHLITELEIRRDYVVKRGGAVVATGTTGKNGTISFSDNPGGSASYTVELGAITSVRNPGTSVIPESIALSNYPNPFNPETTIRFKLPDAAPALLQIYDLQGKLITELLNQNLAAGEHGVRWRALDASGNRVSSGVYLYRLTAGDQIVQRKLLLLK